MILKGNQRGNAKNLALHLMKNENEQVEVHELRGFCSDNLMGALNESYAMSRATKCKQHLFSLSLNPPPDAEVDNEDFEDAIFKVEEKLGLSGQPRAIVFHVKEGRRHCHAVWSRIDAEEIKAVQLSFSHKKLQSVSRELYLENGWRMPRGLVNSQVSDPRNFTLAEWQQAKRIGKDARAIKDDFLDSWAISDSKIAFSHALEERGYKLARGDRRGFVAVDHKGEVYPVSRWAGVKTKQVGEKLGALESLPSVSEAKSQFADEMLLKMKQFEDEVAEKKRQQEIKAKEEQARLEAAQKAKQDALAHALKLREAEEEQIRQERIRKGIKGLLDRLTGKRKQTLVQNKKEREDALARDQAKRTELQKAQTLEKQKIAANNDKKEKQYERDQTDLRQDIEEFKRMKESPPENTRSRRRQERAQGMHID